MKLYAILIVLLGLSLVDCAKSRGSRSSARKITTRRPSPSRNVNTTPYHRTNNVATQGYNHGNAANKATTPRYNIQTHATVRNYPQQTYNQPTQGYNRPQQGYNQPGYKPGYNQPNYHPPSYGQPGYHPQGYNQPGFPGYGGFPGGGHQPWYYSKKDHSTRNSVLAGLGGSALGLYLGYKLGSIGNNINSPFHSNYPGYPSYSVVHHYHHGDKPIPKESNLESKVVSKCENIGDFCTNNTTPLCLTNGTIYCMAPLDTTITCKMNETEYKCINSSILVPCNDQPQNTSCTNTTSISIPCITTINIFGDFATNTLKIHKLSKRSESETMTTTEANNVTTGVDANVTSESSNITTTTSAPIMVGDSPEPSSSLTHQGISNKFCVTIIADPVKPPEITNNIEYLEYLQANPAEKKQVDEKVEDFFSRIVNYIFY
ncbi:uncharacterized protein [Onthophagus taurus]|uniref:uncharacterized protein n=1 Tax=Onthophagus taurus TaxID=166361 RepID=UPI0039BEBF5F